MTYSNKHIAAICIAAFILLLSACQTATVAEAPAESQLAVVDSAALATLTPTPTSQPSTTEALAPVVLYTVAPEATDLPALSLPSSNELATSTPPPSPTAPPTPTASPTPPPTFTPPALPGTSQNEHYWFRRPVPEGGAVWTDKVYPYGSTRGGTLRPHHGVEFNVSNGTPIYAAAAGTVVVAGNDSTTAFGPQTSFYGNLVVIEHETSYQGQPVFTLYGHLSEVQVVVGQQVQIQQQIALSGGTGIADGPHLHFEVRVGANNYQSTFNPLLWLYPFSGNGTVAGRVIRPNGDEVTEAMVTINRIDASSRYRATTTYAQGEVNSDRIWQENFVLDDIEAGYYEIIVREGNRKYEVQTWVYPLLTSNVEIVLDNPAE